MGSHLSRQPSVWTPEPGPFVRSRWTAPASRCTSSRNGWAERPSDGATPLVRPGVRARIQPGEPEQRRDVVRPCQAAPFVGTVDGDAARPPPPRAGAHLVRKSRRGTDVRDGSRQGLQSLRPQQERLIGRLRGESRGSFPPSVECPSSRGNNGFYPVRKIYSRTVDYLRHERPNQGASTLSRPTPVRRSCSSRG